MVDFVLCLDLLRHFAGSLMRDRMGEEMKEITQENQNRPQAPPASLYAYPRGALALPHAPHIREAWSKSMGIW